jgi:hypothetical protein
MAHKREIPAHGRNGHEGATADKIIPITQVIFRFYTNFSVGSIAAFLGKLFVQLNPQQPMEKLRKKYGLKTAQQIKMRIMWITLQRLIIAAFGDTPTNRKIIKQYDADWQLLEKFEKAA